MCMVLLLFEHVEMVTYSLSDLKSVEMFAYIAIGSTSPTYIQPVASLPNHTGLIGSWLFF